MHRGRIASTVTAGLAALVLVATACTGDAAAPLDGTTLAVVAGLYPLQFLAEQIGGDRVSVVNLAQPGAEPHDLELSPQQVAAVADADLVIYIAGLQPALDEVVRQEAGEASLDAAEQVSLLEVAGSGRDPHLWLDPDRFATLGDALAARLGALDPSRAADYRARSAALHVRLTELDQEYAIALRSCRRHEIVVSHAAFGYLTERYGLDQVAISGLSPDAEPTPQHVAEVAQQARAYGATTIFFETLVSPRVAQAIADEVGATTAVLDPIEGLPPHGTADYFSLMRVNLSVLTLALGCT